MDPDILRQAMALGPVGKAELTHQVGGFFLPPRIKMGEEPLVCRHLPCARFALLADTAYLDSSSAFAMGTPPASNRLQPVMDFHERTLYLRVAADPAGPFGLSIFQKQVVEDGVGNDLFGAWGRRLRSLSRVSRRSCIDMVTKTGSLSSAPFAPGPMLLLLLLLLLRLSLLLLLLGCSVPLRLFSSPLSSLRIFLPTDVSFASPAVVAFHLCFYRVPPRACSTTPDWHDCKHLSCQPLSRNWCRTRQRWWQTRTPAHYQRTEQELLRKAAKWMRRRAC